MKYQCLVMIMLFGYFVKKNKVFPCHLKYSSRFFSLLCFNCDEMRKVFSFGCCESFGFLFSVRTSVTMFEGLLLSVTKRGGFLCGASGCQKEKKGETE